MFCLYNVHCAWFNAKLSVTHMCVEMHGSGHEGYVSLDECRPILNYPREQFK